jgi:hypothetical protein
MTLRDYPFKLCYDAEDDALNAFYIPALKASIHYDRSAGFFSSSALAVAATGIARLIANGGTMRLLVGAQLSRVDVEAIRTGYDLRRRIQDHMLQALSPPSDDVMRDRLAALAWMIAQGRLEIRVVLPLDDQEQPLPALEAIGYYHPKTGIFTDGTGARLAFSGSINESARAWQHNYEEFNVYRSWGGPDAQVHLQKAIERFTRLWQGRSERWRALEVPDAVRQALLKYTPAQAPTHDPLETTCKPGVIHDHVESIILADELARERIICQFLRDAPHLVGASGLGAATCTLTPWPHQQTVARRLVARFPSRYLLADEVGLGKTIEAGLVLRQLWLSGVVRRALILAPKSVLRQWQEELYEKFALNVSIYDGTLFCDYWEDKRTPNTSNPWDDVQLALASSQLVKRLSRRETLLDARPWDLVIVDEAHHARRKDFQTLNRYRPNRMLELLNDLQSRTRGLILMTATPMQVHPIEVWDLLNLLGLSDEWGVDGRYFLRFYEQLRRPIDDADWAFVFRMLHAELTAREGDLDPQFEEQARQKLGVVDWQRVCALPGAQNPKRAMRQLPPKAQQLAFRMVKHHTPLRRLTFRNTRDLLRRYVAAGLLTDNVPDRDPRPTWIAMREDESELYQRIEEYITLFYEKYEKERKGLGFVMTVYRRRLTSSFYAIQRSLEKRLSFLRGQETKLELDEDDLEEEALQQDADELDLADRALFKDEIAYVQDFLHQFKMLGEQDTKTERLRADLRQIFHEREAVIVFTHYTDTMDFLRRQLRETYGNQVACYSGRGGERWDGVTWVPVTKEEIKNAFLKDEEIKILLCTEAASEGLNLQTCGVLINYDMPWNPMRVEQRIGRIDRIGQRYDDVWIYNYFYENTVEAQVYQALSKRINLFEGVVGPLQPILAQVGQVIKDLAMALPAERPQKMREKLQFIETQLDERETGFDLDAWAEQAEAGQPAGTPVTLAELAAELTTAPTLKEHLRPHESIENAFWLQLDGADIAVTFDANTFDTHPSTLRLLTFGSPLLESLLSRVEELPESRDPNARILRLKVETPLPRVAYYAVNSAGRPQQLDQLADLRAVLKPSDVPWTEKALAAAQRDLETHVETEWAAIKSAQERLSAAQRGALKARVARLLLDAALVELALGQQPDMFGDETYPVAFEKRAVIGLKRHGYPWAPLVQYAHAHLQDPRPTDPLFVEIQGEAVQKLQKRFKGLAQRANRLMNAVAQQVRWSLHTLNPNP